MQTPDFEKAGGLIPVIVQESATGDVLMLAYMNTKAWELTLQTGEATYYSRSRDCIWVKGKISGHIQNVRSIYLDCDNDTVLLKVDQVGGAACHTGYKTCFHKQMKNGKIQITAEPVFDPKEVYKE